MAAVLTALSLTNLSCPRCRDLTSNLMKSVDAFDIMATGNEGMPVEILISTIRQIVSKAVTTIYRETSQERDNTNKSTENQPPNQENEKTSWNIGVNSTRDLFPDKNLDLDTQNSDRIQQDNPSSTPIESNLSSTLVKQAEKTNRRGRPKGSKNIVQANKVLVNSSKKSRPRKSERKPKTVSSLSLIPEQDEADSGLQKRTSLARSFHGRTRRPIATKEDFDRAKEYMKKIKMDTPDGLFYFPYECTKCFQLFPENAHNVRRHVVSVHYSKRILRKSGKTVVQHLPDYRRNYNKPVKVRLHNIKELRAAKNPLRKNKSRSCLIHISSVESRIPSGIGNLKTARVKHQNSRNRVTKSTSASPSSSVYKQFIPFIIPPNLTVRNPCANFDLEKTVNVRVLVKRTPNLTNIRQDPLGQGESQNSTNTTRTTRDADEIHENGKATKMKEADLNANEKTLN